MSFKLPVYQMPDFNNPQFAGCPNVTVEPVVVKGVAPEGFHATTIFPEYYKVNNRWILAGDTRMDCVVVVKGDADLVVKEFRNLNVSDMVVIGRTEDGSEGIYVHTGGFRSEDRVREAFSFRQSRSRETSYSRDYDTLYELLRYEKENGYILWVMGPAAVFDSDSRRAMVSLIENGYVDVILGGNALATHDLEAALFGTALGQDIYTLDQVPNGHYHHLDAINLARMQGSLEKLVKNHNLKDGIVSACLRNRIPLVLAGSIRDDGPLPGIIADVYEAQDAMREHTRKATTIIALATQLHSIATGNLTPSFRVVNGTIRPLYIYSVDVSEFAVNKLKDRGTLQVTSIVTNVQDFLVNLERNLL
ncbi:MAG: hypothetical protein ACM3UW_09185 [Bacillota bacterium]